MQLVSIRLQDFQCHQDTTIAFDKGVTTIVGDTDKGKSAVLRALRWVALNDNVGGEVVRHGAKKTSVTLRVKDGEGKEQDIVRTRNIDGSLNTYSLDGKLFKSFGLGVPDAVKQVLCLSAINFQAQHDAPFWLSLTAGEVSRQLNAVIDLAIIDTTLANVAAHVRKTAERRELVQERCKELEGTWEGLAAQQQRIEDFTALEAIQKKWKDYEEARRDLGRKLERMRGLDLPTLQDHARDLKELQGHMEAFFAAERDKKALHNLLHSFPDQEACISPPPFAPLEQKRKEWVQAHDTRQKLATLLEHLCWQEGRITAKQEAARRAEAEFHTATDNQPCPLCGLLPP